MLSSFQQHREKGKLGKVYINIFFLHYFYRHQTFC